MRSKYDYFFVDSNTGETVKRIYITGGLVKFCTGDTVTFDGTEYEVVSNRYDFEDDKNVKTTVIVKPFASNVSN